VACVVLAALTVRAARHESWRWERAVFRAVYDGNTPWPLGDAPRERPLFDSFDPLFSLARDSRAFVGLAVGTIVVLLVRRRGQGVVFFLAALGVIALNPVLKEWIARPSPFPLPGDYSFPSGHATASMAVAAAIGVLAHRTRWQFPAIAGGALWLFAVAVPSVADGGHWPSDIVAGWLLAALWVIVIAVADHRLGVRRRALVTQPGARP
jgi:undecaprenyl-diphosphatase